MEIYGNQTYNTHISSINCRLMGNFQAAQQPVMTEDGVVRTFWWHGGTYSPGATVVAHIYELNVGSLVDSILIASSAPTDYGTDYPAANSWHAINMSANLEAGKQYGLALQVNTVSGFQVDISVKTASGNQHSFTSGYACYDAPDPLGSITSVTSWYAFYVEWEVPAHTPTSGFYAPVEALPILTSGRNASGYSSGHQPKYTLDNNPDTWWLANSTTDRHLYYDLGIATTVDAVVVWIHNYNEAYDGDKAIQLSYSSNDITYTSLDAELFNDVKAGGHPITMCILTTPVSARYWRISFLDFNNLPKHERAAVSGVWFTRAYGLPFKHQRPQNENISYHSVINVLPSKIRFASYRGLGNTRKRERNYIFTQEADQFANLRDAYRACRGSLLPCFMQCNFADDTYYALQFVSKLKRGERSFDYFNVPVVFQDVPHDLVPMEAKGLYPLSGEDNVVETTGWWKFNLDRIDYSGNNLTLTAAVLDNTKYIRGVANTGKTAIPYDAYNALYLPNASATPIEINVNSYWSIEFIMCSTNTTASQQAIISKWNSTPTGWFAGLHTGKLFFRLSGTGDDVSGSSVITVADGEWHYCAIVVDRSADEAKLYIDGILDNTIDISSFGGDSQNSDDVTIGDVPNTYIDEIMLARGSATFLTQADITERYNDLRKDYGTWGV